MRLPTSQMDRAFQAEGCIQAAHPSWAFPGAAAMERVHLLDSATFREARLTLCALWLLTSLWDVSGERDRIAETPLWRRPSASGAGYRP